MNKDIIPQNMLAKSEFIKLSDKIVYASFEGQQDQKVIYKLERDSLIDQLYDPLMDNSKNPATVMKFAEGLEQAVKVIGLVVSLYKILKDLYPLFEKQKSSTPQRDQRNLDIETIKNSWTQKMIEQKIDPAMANTIANSFSEDIKNYLKD